MKFYSIIEIFLLISATTYSVSCQSAFNGLQCSNGGTLNTAICTCTCANGYSGFNCQYGKN